MKKIVISIVFSFVALFSFGQNKKDHKVEKETKINHSEKPAAANTAGYSDSLELSSKRDIVTEEKDKNKPKKENPSAANKENAEKNSNGHAFSGKDKGDKEKKDKKDKKDKKNKKDKKEKQTNGNQSKLNS